VKVLLDTHALLWWFADDARLSAFARETLQDPTTQVLVSSASAWEIATKARLGKLAGVSRLLAEFDSLITHDGFAHLPMTYGHALLAGGFAHSHRDPFDRMLAAQGLSENAVILSCDAELKIFGVAVAW
jgi:PIN domain nuclease of toxin-antitoxin system